jgi:hypothetical protein
MKMVGLLKKKSKEQKMNVVTAKMPPKEPFAAVRQVSKTEPDDSTAALVQSIIPMILPIVRKAVCKQLIDDGSVLYNEKPVLIFDENKLPLDTIQLQIDDVFVMDRKSVQRDMQSDLDFEWPMKDKANEMMRTIPGQGREMLVLDLVGLNFLVPFNEGFEFKFPVDLPMGGGKGDLEVGCGKTIEKASFSLVVPRLRVWFVRSTHMCYIAFMEKPSLTPNLNVNIDRGKGDFMSVNLTENGSMDDVVETILSRFGPKLKNYKKKEEDSKQKSNWVGVSAGKAIAHIVQRSMGVKGGKSAPLEIDLSPTIQASIDTAMGKPRPVAVVEANIQLLQKELERAKLAEKGISETREEKDTDNSKEGSTSREVSVDSGYFCGFS